MSQTDQLRWDEKYAGKALPDKVLPDEWLVQAVHGVERGRALDIACGLGHNSIWLAQQGWEVTGLDISARALQLASELERREITSNDHSGDSAKRAISWCVADLDDFMPPKEHYDLCMVFRFLDRIRLPGIINMSLRAGGILVYETFSRDQMTRSDNHLKSIDFTLAENELPSLFPDFDVIRYEECRLADRSVARLVARKR